MQQVTGWENIRDAVKRSVERALGSTVVSHAPRRCGFDQSTGCVVTTVSGHDAFVKVAPALPAESDPTYYAREAAVNEYLSHAIALGERPFPSLIDSNVVEGWRYLLFDNVDGPELDGNDVHQVRAVLERCDEWADAYVPIRMKHSPPYQGLEFGSPMAFIDSAWHVSSAWSNVQTLLRTPRLEGAGRRMLESWANILESPGLRPEADVAFGHNDLKQSNVLMSPKGPMFVDWSFGSFGPRWRDTVNFLIALDCNDSRDRLFRSTSVGAAAVEGNVDHYLIAMACIWLDRSRSRDLDSGLRSAAQENYRRAANWLVERHPDIVRSAETPSSGRAEHGGISEGSSGPITL